MHLLVMCVLLLTGMVDCRFNGVLAVELVGIQYISSLLVE